MIFHLNFCHNDNDGIPVIFIGNNGNVLFEDHFCRIHPSICEAIKNDQTNKIEQFEKENNLTVVKFKNHLSVTNTRYNTEKEHGICRLLHDHSDKLWASAAVVNSKFLENILDECHNIIHWQLRNIQRRKVKQSSYAGYNMLDGLINDCLFDIEYYQPHKCLLRKEKANNTILLERYLGLIILNTFKDELRSGRHRSVTKQLIRLLQLPCVTTALKEARKTTKNKIII